MIYLASFGMNVLDFVLTIYKQSKVCFLNLPLTLYFFLPNKGRSLFVWYFTEHRRKFPKYWLFSTKRLQPFWLNSILALRLSGIKKIIIYPPLNLDHWFSLFYFTKPRSQVKFLIYLNCPIGTTCSKGSELAFVFSAIRIQLQQISVVVHVTWGDFSRAFQILPCPEMSGIEFCIKLWFQRNNKKVSIF